MPPKVQRPSQQDRLFGRDLWFDVTATGANVEVSGAGDWVVVTGREALRQSIIRRLITDPGEFATLTDYGAGMRLFVKSRDTPAIRQEIEERIRGQLARDRRVAEVSQVVTERTDTGALQIFVQVLPVGAGARQEPLTASITVS